MGPRLPGDKGPGARPEKPKNLTHNPFAALAAKVEGARAEAPAESAPPEAPVEAAAPVAEAPPAPPAAPVETAAPPPPETPPGSDPAP
jgi:3'-5' exoribonuclease